MSRKEPCGICAKPDWCCRGEKGWNCMRVESAKVCKNGGWFHPFENARPAPPPLRNPMKQPKPKPPVDCEEIMDQWRSRTTPAQMDAMSRALGVSAQALDWIGAAWAEDRKAMAFPMFVTACHDGVEDYAPCGIRLRAMNGAKFAVDGSKSGIFYPYRGYVHFTTRRIYVCEGPTDLAACLDLGLMAIGRASCRGGEGFILNALSQVGARECVVVCDNDGPGLNGADALLAQVPIRKTKFVPPGKDLRSFVKDGGTAEIFEAMLDNVLPTVGKLLPAARDLHPTAE